MNKIDWKYNASPGWEQSWNHYFNSYCEATDQIYNSIINSNATNFLCLPFLFLMRHSLELGFKTNIYALSKYSMKSYGLDEDNIIKKGHILPPLQKALTDHFNELNFSNDKNNSIYKNFYELNNKLANIVKYFDKIDKDSFAFRYPDNIDGLNSISSEILINLKTMKEKYDESIILLKYMTIVLDDFFEMIDDFKKEYGEESAIYY